MSLLLVVSAATECRLDVASDDAKLALNEITESLALSSGKMVLLQCFGKQPFFGEVCLFYVFATWFYIYKNSVLQNPW